MPDAPLIVPTDSGGAIALHHLGGGGTTAPPILIVHGTISDAEAVHDLGVRLRAEGADCWLLEWGGHGASRIAARRRNFEHPALHDVPLAIDEVRRRSGASSITWIAHSGGGLLIQMYLARHPDRCADVAGVITLGAQVTHAALTPRQKLRLGALWAVTQGCGHTPGALLSVGSEGEPTALLAQWAMWNLTRQWRGADGFAYLPVLANLDTPLLTIAGGADTIAPAPGCRHIFDAWGSEDKEWVLCATSEGFSKDFRHPSLVRGDSARREVDPVIIRWLKRHALLP